MSSSPAPDNAHRRLAVVTGAGSGVGLATVVALREVGTAVVGVDLSDRPADLEGDTAIATSHQVRIASPAMDSAIPVAR